MTKIFEHVYIFSTIIFTVYSQLIMRWQVSQAGPLPLDSMGKVNFVIHLFMNPWVISGLIATFCSGVSWMLAMSKFEISYAYPWIGLNFVLMLFFGVLLFDELLSTPKILGTLLVVLGILIISRA